MPYLFSQIELVHQQHYQDFLVQQVVEPSMAPIPNPISRLTTPDNNQDPSVNDLDTQPGKWGNEWQHQVFSDSREWLESEDCLNYLNIIGSNSSMNWASKPHETIDLDVSNIVQYTLFILKNAMIFYFTDRCPLLTTFQAWAVAKCKQWGWPLLHVKFVGHNFFILYFKDLEHTEMMLETHPWHFK